MQLAKYRMMELTTRGNDEDHIKFVQLKNTFYKIDDFLAETTTKKEQSKGKTLTTKEQQKEQDERSDNILRCSGLKKQIIDLYDKLQDYLDYQMKKVQTGHIVTIKLFIMMVRKIIYSCD